MSGKEKTPGQCAYEGYRAFSRGKSLISGQPIPEWDVLEDDLVNAWEAAATAGAAELAGELNAVRAERDRLREQLAIARGRLTGIALGNAGDPSVAADRALIAIREAGCPVCAEVGGPHGAPAIVTAGTEHLLDPANPDAWQRVADMPAQDREGA